jgi:hypothetical protein
MSALSSFHLTRWALSAVPRQHDAALRVLMALASHADPNRYCYPGQRLIAIEAFGLSGDDFKDHHREQVRRAVRWLEEHGLIEVNPDGCRCGPPRSTDSRLRPPSR